MIGVSYLVMVIYLVYNFACDNGFTLLFSQSRQKLMFLAIISQVLLGLSGFKLFIGNCEFCEKLLGHFVAFMVLAFMVISKD
jgi:hypothetical protein